jgi:ComEC/Rec2-related protein
MLHALKEIATRYIKRVKGLFRYIFDYKILFFSILYILISFLGIKILRNTGWVPTMGLSFALAPSLFFFFFGFLLLRNIVEKVGGEGTPRNKAQKGVHFFRMSGVFLLIVFLVLIRITPLIAKESQAQESMPSFTNEFVSFEAYVVEEPDKRYKIQQLKLRQLQDVVRSGQILSKEHGYILVRVENYRKFSIGQVCRFEGTLVGPENFADFDYITYLKNQKIFYILDNPTFTCFDIEDRREGSIFRNTLVDLKEKILEVIDEVLHEPYSSLLAGILFGKKRRLEVQFEENLRVGGVTHIITASGYNVTVLIVMINKMLFFLPKRLKVIFCLILIWCFAIFIGLDNSIIRACIMNTISLFAVLFGRDNKAHISLSFTAAIFVFLDPLVILNIGFLLSISAILGLYYIFPILKSAKEKITKNFKFFEDYVLPTLSCTVGTLPVTIFTFKTFSIWSVLVNTLVIPVVEGTMLWGVLSLFFFKIHRSLSDLFFTVVNLQLKYLESVVNKVGGLGFGSWEIPESLAVIIAVFSLLFILSTVIYFYPIDNEEYNYYLKNK